MELFEAYKITLLMAGLTGVLMLVQLLIADATAIKLQHTPGYPVDADHKNFLFRATRAHSNTNESVAIFIVFAFFAVLTGSDAVYLNAFSALYFVSRLAHMCFYYADLKLARSISFGFILIGLVGMFITGLIVWL